MFYASAIVNYKTTKKRKAGITIAYQKIKIMID